MVIKVSYENSESSFNFSDLSSVLKAVECASSHVQIHMGNTQSEEMVQNDYHLESVLNGRQYYHYLYLHVLGETSIKTFQLATLTKNICELFDYQIELFAKCVD